MEWDFPQEIHILHIKPCYTIMRMVHGGGGGGTTGCGYFICRIRGFAIVPQGMTSHDLSSYVWSLPASARPLLEQQLDWDHEGVDKDLTEIAHHMLDWEEKFCSHLGLTGVDVHDIKELYSGKPELQVTLIHSVRYKNCSMQSKPN